jgi:hypothetical protein
MKAGPFFASGLACVLTGVPMFILGQAVGHNDSRIFRAAENDRAALIARSCGKHASLWRQHASGEYACIHLDSRGESVVDRVPDAPLLSAQR